MKVLIIDKLCMGLTFALRCRQAGHEVRWVAGRYRNTGKRNPIGEGFGLDKRHEWQSSMKWADLIVLTDNCAWMEELESWHKKGFPIFGPNLAGAALECNRELGQAVLGDAGIPCLPCHKFARLSEAEAFLNAHPKRYVSKPDTDQNKALSYVSKSPRDMAFMLDYWRKNSKVNGSFIFQEFVPGIEVAVGGWFGQGGFSKWFLENFEHKKLMDGEIGVNTGEMGTVMRYVEKSALAETLLRPIEGYLHRIDYKGFIDVSVMVDAEGTPWPLEFTCRPGWPLFNIQQSLHPDPVGWMGDLLEGRDTLKPSTDIAVGVLMAIPDFPYSNLTRKEVCNYPIYGWEDVPEKNLHFDQVMMGEAPDENLRWTPMPVTAGDEVIVISGNGETVCTARKAAYRNLKCIQIPNSPMYRTDIGFRLKKQLPTLHAAGWVKSWEYGNA